MALWLAAWAEAAAAVLAVSSGDGALGFHNTATLHAFDGSARTFDGQIDTAALTGRLSVQAASLTTGLGPRDSRLLSWCLEAPRFPTIELVVSSITGAVEGLRAAAGAGTVTLVGTLTVRDTTREVAIPAAYAWEGTNLRLNGRYELAWPDWNVPDPSIVLSKLDPDMVVTFDLLARAVADAGAPLE